MEFLLVYIRVCTSYELVKKSHTTKNQLNYNRKIVNTCKLVIAPEAKFDNLPATLETPCLTLSFTSSKSGEVIPRPCGGNSCLPKYSADEIEEEPWNRFKFASGPDWKKS